MIVAVTVVGSLTAVAVAAAVVGAVNMPARVVVVPRTS
jgi:hypothetical protein